MLIASVSYGEFSHNPRFGLLSIQTCSDHLTHEEQSTHGHTNKELVHHLRFHVKILVPFNDMLEQHHAIKGKTILTCNNIL